MWPGKVSARQTPQLHCVLIKLSLTQQNCNAIAAHYQLVLCVDVVVPVPGLINCLTPSLPLLLSFDVSLSLWSISVLLACLCQCESLCASRCAQDQHHKHHHHHHQKQYDQVQQQI